jgi:ATP-dependent DNA helicase RecG
MQHTKFLDTPIEYLKGVGPVKGELLKKELGIFTFRDFLYHFPYRYIDKTRFHQIRDLHEQSGQVLLKGVLRRLETLGEGRKKRLVGRFRDDSGAIDLVWFSGIKWVENKLQVGSEYIVYGKVYAFQDKNTISHPEMELAAQVNQAERPVFDPVYPSTEKLNQKGLDAKNRRKLLRQLLDLMPASALAENLPAYLNQSLQMVTHQQAMAWIHFPRDQDTLEAARLRLKFEELFFLQLRLLQLKGQHQQRFKGFVFEQLGTFFHTFFNEHLPFELTDAQKNVLKEIRRDLRSGVQMNRLLQGDVGSGKTIVAVMCMLMAVDNGFQACLMAPTEILALQHYTGVQAYLEPLGLQVGFLSGTVSGKKRRELLSELAEGKIHILIGTHALIEDPVQFHQLGLAITDEQHRFGVEQRARLWGKSKPLPPHILVMTATPIPRTLAMTLYGDLDVSVINALPPGRKPIQTLHKRESHRLQIMGFIRQEIQLGRQVYVVYPLIEESEKLDLLNLETGYHALTREFPPPQYRISVVHGKMKPADKDYEMQQFVSGKTQIMVATTVIEVGVNVPNASVMIIENAERFGLSQLHQLRGRVGRGAEQSYCILMTGFKLTEEARQRIQTMVRTNDGFEIAEADLKLRGPGNMEGTQQSGILQFRIADLVQDGKLLEKARAIAQEIIARDPSLEKDENQVLKFYLDDHFKSWKGWNKIS